MSTAPFETLRSVLRAWAVPRPHSTEQRGVLDLDLLSLGSRVALGCTFLLSILDRFGLYGRPGERGVSWGTFEHFLTYTANVNAFAPTSMIPFLGGVATVAELVFGLTVLLGVFLTWAAFGAACLLFIYGLAMAISFGIKAPFDYSVFSGMCCALFLGVVGSDRWTIDSWYRRRSLARDIACGKPLDAEASNPAASPRGNVTRPRR